MTVRIVTATKESRMGKRRAKEEDLELLAEVELYDAARVERTFSLSCVFCGVEVRASDQETLLKACKGWKAYLVQEYEGARCYSIYHCAVCPLCRSKLEEEKGC